MYLLSLQSSLKTEENIEVMKTIPLDRILIETGADNQDVKFITCSSQLYNCGQSKNVKKILAPCDPLLPLAPRVRFKVAGVKVNSQMQGLRVTSHIASCRRSLV